jgi:type IV secretion system protein VirB2
LEKSWTLCADKASFAPKAAVLESLLEVLMPRLIQVRIPLTTVSAFRWNWTRPTITLTLLLIAPALAVAQSPFDTGFTAMQALFTGTVAKVASLIAIVIGGYQFAHGEPGAKKTLAGVAAGTGIAVMAANVLTWLWGV